MANGKAVAADVEIDAHDRIEHILAEYACDINVRQKRRVNTRQKGLQMSGMYGKASHTLLGLEVPAPDDPIVTASINHLIIKCYKLSTNDDLLLRAKSPVFRHRK